MPLVTTTPDNFDSILSSTLQRVSGTLQDQVFDELPLFWYLKNKGKAPKSLTRVSGGESIICPLLYGASTAVGWYTKYEQLDTTPQEGHTVAQYLWKQLAGTVTISGLEEEQNKGSARIFNLLESKFYQTKMTMQTQFNEAAFAGNATDTKKIVGLAQHTAATGTIGGIAKATYSWWQGQTATATDFNGALGTGDGLAKMANVYNTCSFGPDHPDLLITTQAVYEAYEGVIQPNIRYGVEDVGAAGFESLKFKGATLLFDRDATAETIYFINTRYLYLVTNPNKNFATTNFVKPTNQDAKTALILWYGNLVCSQARRQGYMDGGAS